MNLKSLISEELWSSIKDTYEASNYSHAINDGMIHLSNKLREKGDVDGDGVDLVSKTLSLKNPKIKLNKLQTKTDTVIQEGFYFLVRGLYQAIRDPRSHESHADINDTKETADSILLFINFILENIEKAKGSFVLEDLKRRVFDKDFFYSDKYANLLVREIPKKKRFDTLVEIYRDKMQGDIYKVSLFLQTLLFQLPTNEQDEFFSIISAELIDTSNIREIIINLKIIPEHYWGKIKDIPRMRIEGKIISAIEEGEVDWKGNITGGWATWAREHLEDFTLADRLRSTFNKKIKSDNRDEELYVFKYFLEVIPRIIQSDISVNTYVNKISSRIINNDYTFKEALLEKISYLPREWQKKFQNAFINEEPGIHETVFLPDGSPLFPIEDDEIPF